MMANLLKAAGLARCPGCGARSGPALCRGCHRLLARAEGRTDVALAPWQYTPPLSDLLARLKYRGDFTVLPALSELALALGPGAWPKDAVVCPVPLHWWRQYRRGFNQAALLATAWAQPQGLPVFERALVRTRATRAQADLAANDRHGNVAGAFAARGCVRGRSVIVFDDVVTTGATLAAAAVAARSGGAAAVWAVALAGSAQSST